MRKSLKSMALLVVCALFLTLIPVGCGSNSSGDDITVNTQGSSTEVTTNSDVQKESTSSASKSGVKKKVIIVQENENPYNVDSLKNTIKALEAGGYKNGETVEVEEIHLNNNPSKCSEVVSKIKQESPDVVVLNLERFYNDILKPLEDTNISVISDGIDSYLDANNNPLHNITGTKVMPANFRKTAFEFLNKIVPIQGKKAVFLTAPGAFTKEDIQNSLTSLNIPLKEYVESPNFEDYKAAVEKYNKDSEVGWILVGTWPGLKKDGSKWSVMDTANWDRENRKKPTVTYWDVAVQLGILCGLGIDIPTIGTQKGEMLVKLLNGESIKSIAAQEPRKINIVLNQKRAQFLGVTFPLDILGSAKVYVDYEGHTTADIK